MDSFLVVGCGSIGKRHMANLLALGAENVVACDPVDASRASVREQFGDTVETVADFELALASRPSAVLICAPTNLHLPIALHAAEEGCNLFIEKPLSHTYDGVDEFIAVVEEKKLISMVGCNMRFHPGIIWLKTVLDEGRIGKPLSVRAEFGQYLPDWHPTEDYRKNYSALKSLGGGVILDCIHELDLVRWLAGEVTQVACFADKVSDLEIETEDIATLLMRHAGGGVSEVHLDYIYRGYRRAMMVMGEKGSVQWDFSSGTARWYSAEQDEWTEFSNPEGWEVNTMYLDEMAFFLKCLRGERSPELDVREGAQVLRLALAAKQSSASNMFISL